MSRILVVEDDANLAAGLEYNLARAGYEVVPAEDGDRALTILRTSRNEERFDLVILDLMLPRRSGFEVLEAVTAEKVDVPILILSARDDEIDKLRGFDLGAADYVTKPFSIGELLARVKLRLRERDDSQPLVLGRRRVDLRAHRVIHDDRSSVTLTKTEVALLTHLTNQQGVLIPRDELLRAIWNLGPRSTRSLDTHVGRLRKKLEEDASAPRHLLTVFGVGYRLVLEPEDFR